MIEVKIENEEFIEKNISGNATAILAELACIMDRVIGDVVVATNNRKTKEELLEFVNKALQKCWEDEGE